MFSVLRIYREAFSGLSANSWMLALIMFINRSGSMVIPFMSVYLKEELNMSLTETGVLMAVFGLGSIMGSFLGGFLTDRIGHFKVQFLSLTIGGSMFFVLMFMKDFNSFLICIFFLSTILQTLPPANASSVSFYARPENVTRAFALNRMALNLGFAIGPTIGGLIASVSYEGLFIADGITCILAGFVFLMYFRNKPGNKPVEKKINAPVSKSPYTDRNFLWFIFMVSLFAITFFQLFTTIPFYYRDKAFLSEEMVGILLGLNGIIVFSFEMIIVHQLKDRKKLGPIIIFGLILMSAAYALLNVNTSLIVLISSMMLLSFAEIFAMPFMATITVQRSDEQNRGRYMGLYTFAFSLAFAIAPYSGTLIAASSGFNTLWWTMCGAALLIAVFFRIVLHSMLWDNK
jgi:predicted MFS family arabinose efflux permease